MPYKEGAKWRAVVTRNGQRYTSLKRTKKEAAAWESQKNRELDQEEKSGRQRPPDMDLMTFCAKYLDHARQFNKKTCDNKRRLCRRILKVWGADTRVEDITPATVLDYLESRAKETSVGGSVPGALVVVAEQAP